MSVNQSQPIWRPSDPSSAPIEQFRRHVNKKFNLTLSDYFELWQWSCDHIDLFWEEVWTWTGVIATQKWEKSIDPGSSLYPPPLWFSGARLNFAENLLRHHKSKRIALIQSSEVDHTTGKQSESAISYEELYSLVAQVARSLRHHGIKPGDRVASYASNCIENVVTFLATSAVGAIWCSAAADFSPSAVLERLQNVRPKLLLVVNAVRYNGRVHDHLPKVYSLIEGLEESRTPNEQRLEYVTVVSYVKEHRDYDHFDSQNSILSSWESFLRQGEGPSTIEFEQLDFNHPLWILFSSGTTGKPKAIVHRAGGMLLQLSKEHLIHGGLTQQDVFFQYTTPGWMMWNFLITGLVSGCSIVLYDGSPLKPVNILWDLAERWGVTIFGTSAAYLSALEKSGYNPKSKHSNLKITQVLSTGSPLRADLYSFVTECIGNVLIGSITGGTDICSLFAGHNTSLPVYPGEIQCRNLGMSVHIYSNEGKQQGPNEEGDLVCTKPFPCQPLGFWNQDEERHMDTYYTKFSGVWYHGDFVCLSPNGGLVMLGRSDGILNPGGIRFGSSEIYEVIEKAKTNAQPDSLLKLIDATLVVGLKTPKGDDEVVVLFLVVDSHVSNHTAKDPAIDWERLSVEVKQVIRERRSARHVPKFVRQVSAVPLTMNGKLAEVPAKKLINGVPISNINSATLQNADVLQEYVQLGQELRQALSAEA